MRIIEIVIGLFFIVSAVTKLIDFPGTISFFISISGLDFALVKTGLIVLSLLEISVGVSFLINTWDKQIIFFSTICLLSFFIVLNIYFFFKGYTNCGCFGTQFTSTPLASLLKNIIICSYLLYAKYSSKKINLAAQ
jgi:uncharacterized membrane protein YphA (DoxX/SURF4 family)